MNQAKHLAEIIVFVEVAKQLSFVRAAERLRMDTAALSRSVANLEKRLGTRLFQRTTRLVSLTEGGVVYAQKCKEILNALDEANSAVAELHGSPRGLLRVSLPMTFAQLHICPLLPAFLKENPAVSLELTMSDEIVDLVANNIDVAIRIGAQSDSRLVIRQLAQSKRVLCASTEYLQQYGCPRHPSDLQRHNCLIFSPRSGEHAWTFHHGKTTERTLISGTVKANNSIALLNSALAGIGIASIATHVVSDYIRTGQLNVVLPEWKQDNIPIYAVYPSNQYIPLKVRAFVDFFSTELAAKTKAWTA
jgi:DNA-binding transcriptional LysR family regulator